MAFQASEFAPEDIISNMPDNVVTNILHRLPLQDAVRTGILSRNWRFKWTMLSELVFGENFFAYLIEKRGEDSFAMIVSRLLLHFSGAVTKCVLCLTVLNVEDIHHLILFLSRKGIMDLTLTNWSKPTVRLPTHLFSCLDLKHLNITGCCFNPPPGFHGFPNLLSLELHDVQFGGSDLGEFLTRCPLLETLNLDYLSYTGKVKLVEIAKLENLKVLSLSLCHLETTTTIISSSNVFELLCYLPKLQELGLDFQDCNLTEGGAKKKFPTAFPYIKALKLTSIDFGNGIMLSYALEMIIHFPNLHTLEFTPLRSQIVDPVPIPVQVPIPEIEYRTMGLQRVVFTFFNGSENEIHLIKYFLARSPSLKQIVIHSDWYRSFGEHFMLAKKLLKLHRASPKKQSRLMASEFEPEDFISIMPDIVVTDILNRLPLLDVVRTSVLSRNWRFKWTLLSHLKFDEDFFVYLTNTKGVDYSFWKTISSLLLHLNGAITRFVIDLGLLDVEDIHHLIVFLSKKGIKDLTLTDRRPLGKLPTHLFSCLQLKHLNICGCGFHLPPGFHGFPNLLSLELRAVIFGGSDLGEFLTRSPLLETLNVGHLCYTGNVKLVEIAKLQNLKILFLSVSHLETTSYCNVFDNVFELVGYLPKLQDLGLDFKDYRLTAVGAKRKFPAAFPFIKALKLTTINLRNDIMLSCALEMIRHFPNVQNIEIEADMLAADPLLIQVPIPKVEYNLMKLQSVVFQYLKGSENEMCLIKYLLACSPSLSKIDVHRHCCLEPFEQLFFAKKLLKLRRASTVAEINFN
ncbi:hypothetical protein M8C21_006029 [Ambrosia artemisiifolia]|uniref:F-box domain-containing protein n=1 Tax=Ambrosia artemisiifolia TaxID=4212 RepID=A0AAD5D8Z7_AMBAR|nr:hypothetical protein M8C21_006029 [Ambrosia artemisiifolia]